MSLHDALLAKAFGGGNGGGGTSIDVTAAVGQTIIVKEVDASGKPTKWESADYQPRTHWAEDVLLFDGVPEDEIDGNMVFVAAAPTIGNTYKITYNGTTYSCVCMDSAIMGEAGSCVLGNVALAMGTGDTGEPFLFAYLEGMWFCTMFDGATSPHISVTEVVYTPIPTDYLKNAFPYYIDIIVKEDGTMTCAETVVEITKMINSGREVKTRLTNGVIKSIAALFYIMNNTFVFLTPALGSAGSSDRTVLHPQEDGTFLVDDNIG